VVVNNPGQKDHLKKFLDPRIAIVDVGIAETNEEAWLRYLTTHPKTGMLMSGFLIVKNQVQNQEILKLKLPKRFLKVIKGISIITAKRRIYDSAPIACT
jgi:hypothetical protein